MYWEHVKFLLLLYLFVPCNNHFLQDEFTNVFQVYLSLFPLMSFSPAPVPVSSLEISPTIFLSHVQLPIRPLRIS